MTDSEKENELDNYGVWVKKPPRDIHPDADTGGLTESEDSFDIAADLPDFSSLDDIPDLSDIVPGAENTFTAEEGQDTALTSEELSDITENADTTEPAVEPVEKATPPAEKNLSGADESRANSEINPEIETNETDGTDSNSGADNTTVPLSADTSNFSDLSENSGGLCPADASIPDTFDQETAAFTEPGINSGSEDDSIPPTEPKGSVADTDLSVSERSNSILLEIQKELTALKDEISSLKNSFVELKNREIGAPVPGPGKSEDTGFFSNTGDDDTIALSGDELDNILNHADFTKETPEPAEQAAKPEADTPVKKQDESEQDDFYANEIEHNSNLKVDFSTENLSEPVLDNINLDADVTRNAEELPDEITVPKDDDILVESSPTDLMDSGKETQKIEDAHGEQPDSDTDHTITENIIPETIDDLYPKEPSIGDSISDENLDYLSSGETNVSEPQEQVQEPEPLEEAEPLTQEPQEQVQEPEPFEEPVPPAQEKNVSPEAGSLPGDLKEDIKSVLSYMDQLLENLPDDKISEFAQSEQFVVYKKLFTELGLA